MDDDAIKATKKNRNQNADNSFENVQHNVAIQIYYGEKAISSLTLALKSTDFQHDNLTIDSFQSYLLETIKIRLNKIKELQVHGDDVKSYEKISKKEIKRLKKEREILLENQNDINDLHQSISVITPKDLTLHDTDSFKIDAPLEFKDLKERLEAQKKKRESAVAAISQLDIPFKRDFLPVASFICHITRPEKKLAKAYEKYNLHAEKAKQEQQAVLQATSTSNTKDNSPVDSDELLLLENEDENSNDQHENRRCQIL